ncbi:MAG: DUF4842 domain-containing protein [Bacteroidales bacterium]|jgi:hypothetical protein|nr:DUF4842 domain-containing protein [Bacteroidales bacterium]
MNNVFKKLVFLFAIVVLSVSCMQTDDLDSPKLDLKNLEPFSAKNAPIKEGYQTIISVDGKQILSTNIEMVYLSPKNSQENIEYIPQAKDVIYGGSYDHQFLACFEDTRSGDNDYNDFIVYITQDLNITKNAQDKNLNDVEGYIYFQPIAYGASQKLQFGAIYGINNTQTGLRRDLTDTLIATNVRGEMFYGEPDGHPYINTQEEVFQTNSTNNIKRIYINKQGLAKNTEFIFINPYIINQGVKDSEGNFSQSEQLFVAINVDASMDYTQFVGQSGYPLGIASKNKIAWAKEKKDIASIYSGFNNWVIGNTNSLGQVTDTTNVYKGEVTFVQNPKNLSW